MNRNVLVMRRVCCSSSDFYGEIKLPIHPAYNDVPNADKTTNNQIALLNVRSFVVHTTDENYRQVIRYQMT